MPILFLKLFLISLVSENTWSQNFLCKLVMTKSDSVAYVIVFLIFNELTSSKNEAKQNKETYGWKGNLSGTKTEKISAGKSMLIHLLKL